MMRPPATDDRKPRVSRPAPQRRAPRAGTAPPAAASLAGGESASGEPASILIIDDEAVVRLYVGELLSNSGYRVETAADAAEAWKKLQVAGSAGSAGPGIGPRPDLILLDVMLPDADGLVLCREFKARPATRDIPVVFLTAKGERGAMVHGFEAGGVDYIIKPFDAAVLLARVRTHTTLARLSRGLTEALAERTASLEQANRRLRELNVAMALVEERERGRLAQELHDTTIQQLVLARMVLAGAKALPGPDHGRLLALVDLSLAQLRSLVFELSPPLLREQGLAAALRRLAEHIEAQWDLPIDCRIETDPGALPEAATLILFQGARELLINAAKHADADRTRLTLRRLDHELELEVVDDGIGFAATAAVADAPAHTTSPKASAGAGYGLQSLRARLELLGGRLVIDAGGVGGRVCMRLPVGGAVPAAAAPEGPPAARSRRD
jgi:signal transduction histidine kinase